MITNDYSDLFMIPISNVINNQIWNTLVETKIILVPFIVAILFFAFKCRSQGEDEGAPAIQCYKHVETKFIAMILIMYFSCQAMTNLPANASDIVVKPFTCTSKGQGVFSYASRNDIENSIFIRNLPASYGTLWQGLLNQFSVGMTNAGIGALPCYQSLFLNSKPISFREGDLKTKTYEPDNPSLIELTKQFAMQCYNPALKRIAATEITKSQSTNFKSLTFNSQEIKKYYQGMLTFEQFKNPITLTVKKYLWDDQYAHTLFPGSVTVDCDEAEAVVNDKIAHEIFTSDTSKYFEATNLNGDPINITEPKYVNQVFNNIIANTKEQSEKSHGVWRTLEKGVGLGLAGLFGGRQVQSSVIKNGANTASDSDSNEDLSLNDLRNAIWAAAGSWEAMFQSGTAYQYQILAPEVISFVKACLIVAMPLIMLFSGYSAKALLLCTMGYFAIDFTRCLIEFGTVIDTILMSIKEIITHNHHPIIESLNPSLSVLNNLSAIMSLSMAAIWFALLGVVGIRLTAAMSMADKGSVDTSSGARTATNAATKVASV